MCLVVSTGQGGQCTWAWPRQAQAAKRQVMALNDTALLLLGQRGFREGFLKVGIWEWAWIGRWEQEGQEKTLGYRQAQPERCQSCHQGQPSREPLAVEEHVGKCHSHSWCWCSSS